MAVLPCFLCYNIYMSQQQKTKSIFGRIVHFALTLFLLASAFAIVVFQQQIRDYATVFNYNPSAEIFEITQKISLTKEAERIFYATDPQVEGAEKFNENCTNQLEQTTVLGCYKDDRIYIFDVQNPELEGIKEATAAHELLHAVWARLGENERASLSSELLREYARVKTPELEQVMENYKITEPGQHENELHSILATELVNLSQTLENHYARYFTDRTKILSFYNSYNSRFTELREESDRILKDTEALKSQIDLEVAEYQLEMSNLNANISQFNTWARNGYYTSQWEFEADRAKLQSEIGAMNMRRDEINSKVDYFNSLTQRLNQISIESKQLTDSIDSRLTAPSDI